MEDMSHIARY